MDVRFENHGSIWLAHLLTEAARHWVEHNVAEDAQFFGDALVVEPRYVEALHAGMIEAGLDA